MVPSHSETQDDFKLSIIWRQDYSLLLLLSHFSRIRLCVTPETAAHQAPLSLGFSRQEHWSGLPFPSPMHESEVAQSRTTLSDPMDYSLPGSSVHGIFQARVLEWNAIAFSEITHYCIPIAKNWQWIQKSTRKKMVKLIMIFPHNRF